VQANFTKFGLISDYVYPRDETKKDNSRPVASNLFAMTSNYGSVQYVAHGDPPYLRIEAGRSGRGHEKLSRHRSGIPQAIELQGADGRPTSSAAMSERSTRRFTSNLEFIPTAAIHAGAVAFMAPNKCQSICFWRYAPKGAGASQCIYFWENAIGKKMPIGQALIEAKWTAYQEWKTKQFEADRGKDSDNAIEIDAPSMILYGDPALRMAE